MRLHERTRPNWRTWRKTPLSPHRKWIWANTHVVQIPADRVLDVYGDLEPALREMYAWEPDKLSPSLKAVIAGHARLWAMAHPLEAHDVIITFPHDNMAFGNVGSMFAAAFPLLVQEALEGEARVSGLKQMSFIANKYCRGKFRSWRIAERFDGGHNIRLVRSSRAWS